jgi:hypothetical protein
MLQECGLGVAPLPALNGAAFSDRAWEVGLPSTILRSFTRATQSTRTPFSVLNVQIADQSDSKPFAVDRE